MTGQQIIDIITGAISVMIQISLPFLGTALVVGLIISVFQAATQINESTLSFLPKIAAIILVLTILSPWMVVKIHDYTKQLYEKIPEIGRTK